MGGVAVRLGVVEDTWRYCSCRYGIDAGAAEKYERERTIWKQMLALEERRLES